MDSRTEAFAACPDTGCDWGSFYLGWKASREALEAENAKLVAALDEIAHPVKYMRLRLKDGELLDGRMAMEVTGSIDFYQAIAIAALAKKELNE